MEYKIKILLININLKIWISIAAQDVGLINEEEPPLHDYPKP
jgi:hypothetical protein